MRVQHGVAEEDQHQRGRHDDPERAGDGDDRGAARQRNAGGGEPRLRHARQREHAGADRTVHRSEQRAEHKARDDWPRRPRDNGDGATIERIGNRQPIHQGAHQHIERNGLEKIVFEEIDQSFRQRADELNRHGAADCSHNGTKTSGGQQHDGGRNTRENDAETDEQQQAQAEPGHQRGHWGRGRQGGAMSSSTPSIKTNSAISNSANLMMK